MIYFGNDFLIRFESQQLSESIGTESNGSLKYGKRMPSKGKNFETFSYLMSFIGRTCIHSSVRSTLLDAYKILEKTQPNVSFVYGEMGWCSGGRFRPHRTHQNGLSVDFMMPVKDTYNFPRQFPSDLMNLFGYKARFNSEGEYKKCFIRGKTSVTRCAVYKIDFEAIVAHLKALEESGIKYGVTLKKIIIDPPLLALLKKTKGYSEIASLPFMKKQAWYNVPRKLDRKIGWNEI